VSDKILCSGWHWSFGWLRRPELDDNGGFAYEDGDGDLVFSHNAWHRHAVYLACLQDKETKEKYLTFSHVPKSHVKSNSRK
jgi:hypothetical protein